MLANIKHALDEIIRHGSPEDMHRVEDLFLATYTASDEPTRKHVFHHLHKIAYGPHLSRDMADDWTSHMLNKDGSTGPHWSYDQTSPLAEHRNKEDFFAVLNMMWSDYFSPALTQQNYISLARDFIDDKDAGDDKTLKYYCEIAKKW